MPQRKNSKGDIGTSKIASDSYDTDNIYLTEEGWVYRHYKTSDKTKWWDEIIVAGQVVPGGDNDPVEETNLPKLGTVESPEFESSVVTTDGFDDIDYSDHEPSSTKKVTTGGGTAYAD